LVACTVLRMPRSAFVITFCRYGCYVLFERYSPLFCSLYTIRCRSAVPVACIRCSVMPLPLRRLLQFAGCTCGCVTVYSADRVH
jgi:hypothetical protein